MLYGTVTGKVVGMRTWYYNVRIKIGGVRARVGNT